MKVWSLGQWLLLGGICLYSFNSYLVLLRDPFVLERLALAIEQPAIETVGLQLADSLKVNYLSLLLFIVAIVSSFLGLLLLWLQRSRIQWSFQLLLVAIVFISFPSLSTDVFDYTNSNRVAFVHQANPWQHPVADFPDDPQIYLGSWIDRASVYPPVTFVFSSIVYYLFGAGVVGSIIGFKALATGAYLVIALTLKQHDQVEGNSVVLFSLNPLILIEFIGNAHNDLILGMFMLGGVVWLLKERWLASSLSFGLGILAKFSLALYIPLVCWFWLKSRQYRIMGRWLVGFGITLSAGVVIMSTFISDLWQNLLQQFDIYQKSLPTVIRFIYIQLLGQDQIEVANTWQKYTTYPIFGLTSLWILVRSQLKMVDTLVVTMMAYLFIQAPMLQPWYLAWFLPLVPLAKSERIQWASLVFCISALLTYPTYYLSLFLSPLSIYWQLILALVMIGPPIVTLVLPNFWINKNNVK